MRSLALALLFATPLSAEEDVTRLCTIIGDVADQVMTAYYLNIPMSDLIEMGSDNDAFVTMVLDAYDEPRYSMPELVEDSKFEFRTRWEQSCYQQFQP